MQPYGDSLGSDLGEALADYNRAPGFDELTRLYRSTTGYQGLEILIEALKRRWPNDRVERYELYVQLRFRLRSPLRDYLLRRIVLEHPDIPVLRDALFAGDVGV